MKINKTLIVISLLVVLTLTFTACSDDDSSNLDPQQDGRLKVNLNQQSSISAQAVDKKIEDKITITEVELKIYKKSDYDSNGTDAEVVESKTEPGESSNEIGTIAFYLPPSQNYVIEAVLSGDVTNNGETNSVTGIYQGVLDSTGVLEEQASKSVTVDVTTRPAEELDVTINGIPSTVGDTAVDSMAVELSIPKTGDVVKTISSEDLSTDGGTVTFTNDDLTLTATSAQVNVQLNDSSGNTIEKENAGEFGGEILLLPKQSQSLTVNQQPYLEVADQTVDEDSELQFTVNAEDPDGDSLTSLSVSNKPSGASFDPSSDNSSGTFTWTPTYEQSGSYDVTFAVESSNGGVNSETTTITVNDVNRAPSIDSITNVSDGSATITEGKELSLAVNATDEDGDDLTYVISGTDADEFSQSGNTFTWTPPIDDYSSDNTFDVTLEVSDGTDTTTKDVTITVDDDTTAPSASVLTITSDNDNSNLAKAGDTITLSLTASEEITTPSATVAGNTATINNAGDSDATTWEMNYTVQSGDAEGTVSFSVTAEDAAGNSSTFSSTTDVSAVEIDTTAPNWTTEPNITTAADTSSVGISAAVDEGGTAYYKVMSDGAEAPTASAVQDAGNSVEMEANTEKEITIDNINEGTENNIFFVAQDSGGNLQSDDQVRKINFINLNTGENLAVALNGTVTTINVTSDLTLDSGEVHTVDRDLTIDLAGSTLTLNDDIEVTDGNTLTLTSEEDGAELAGTGEITGGVEKDNVITAHFEVTSLNHDGPVSEGQDLNVDVEVENTGSAEATQDVVLSVDNNQNGTFDIEADTQSLTLSGGEAKTVNLTYSTQDGDATEVDVKGSTDDNSMTATAAIETSDFAGGDGSSSSPYKIENWNHLDKVRDNLSANFILVNDLDQSTVGYNDHVKTDSGNLVNSGKGWDPIGVDFETTFAGEFNGNGKTIEGLTINRPTEDNVGLFASNGSTSGEAYIHNLTLIGVDIIGGNSTGALSGINYNQITNCHISGDASSVSGQGSYAGGLVGDDSGVITRSSASGSVTGEYFVGGLVGASQGEIIKSYSSAFVTQAGDSSDISNGCGGLVGKSSEKISNSYSTGDVNASNAVNIGGLVGRNAGIVEKVYATGDVASGTNSGKLVGKNELSGEITDGYWKGEGETGIGWNQNTATNITGLTTSEMQGDSAESNMSALDFTNIWSTLTSEYPKLQWQ
ncbi:beta strand repeat-containing protein [Halanaerobacter jeridensis]|uniref:Cadherin domain-containing protein n=1 Tax=Halanaerobacter jeridensis TaxID=706427 RepID=A0A938XST8_9FIRM|nr:Ig-like domain-containing protein [Halanaerobacter jeridensis]MBM7557071.1 hypothetical protein [Halanaerobacter jeridensis]